MIGKRTIGGCLAFVLGMSFAPICASGATLFGDTVGGAVRRSTDAAGTNYFSSPTGVVNNGAEFTGTDGDYQIEANIQSTDFVNLTVARIPTTGGTPPNYRFSFTDLDFSPGSQVVGVTKIGGTPNVNLSDVVIGPDSAAFTIGSTFLSNGGSIGLSVRFDTVVPEPASLATFATASLMAVRRRRA